MFDSKRNIVNYILDKHSPNSRCISGFTLLSKLKDKEVLFVNKEEETNTLSQKNYTNWKYYINEYGYRDKWNLDSTKKIGFFGCEVTFGIGLDSPYIFPNLVSNILDYDCYNFGIPHASVEKIANLIPVSYNSMKNLNTMVIILPDIYRVFCINSKNNEENDIIFKYRPIPDILEKEINFYINDANLYYKAMNSILLIKNFLEKNNINFVISSWSRDTKYLIKYLFNKKHYFHKHDYFSQQRARDDKHPGKKYHAFVADAIVHVLNKKLELK